ncbi:MAG: D-aminoacylase [Thermodesulfovibrionia bacterium]|nr:D-aminoacylase [Thermodesulfovibrionia bacterium]
MAIDYLIKGGFIIDGTSPDASPKIADIAIEGDRIKAIGELSGVHADNTINIKGLCLCPGFIDSHAHSDFTLLADGRAEGKICQGVTTEMNGNCGLSAAPLYREALEHREKELANLNIKERWNTFPEYFSILEKKGFAVNFATLAGHGNLRASVAGYSDKPLSTSTIEKTKELLNDAISAGAKGISTGLIYPPGIFTDTPEIIELAREAAKSNGIYTTHMRSEGSRLLESVNEVMTIVNESGIKAHISHLKTNGENNWKKLKGVFEQIEHENIKGFNVTCDRYPYTASSTDLDTILPAWAFEGGHKKELHRLRNEQAHLKNDFLKKHPEKSFWKSVMISSVTTDKNKWMEGKTLFEISLPLKKSPINCMFDLLIDDELRTGAIFFSMNEDNLREILKRPYAMIGSDSSARSFDGITSNEKPHPRAFGSFPRILGKYVREYGVLKLNEAIYKMTGLPARTFNIKNRGIIKEGCFADITVFDPKKVNDTAEYNKPFVRPKGIHHVFVNGTPVLFEGQATGKMPGRIIR